MPIRFILVTRDNMYLTALNIDYCSGRNLMNHHPMNS